MPCLRSGSWWSVVSALCGRTYHANATSSVPGAIASWAPRPQDQGSPTLQVPQIAWGDRRGRVCFFRPPRHFARNTVGGKQRRAVAPLTTAEITFVGSHARHTPARQLPETPSPELCSLGPLVRERAQESEIFRTTGSRHRRPSWNLHSPQTRFEARNFSMLVRRCVQ
jgi:hypothetical protein